MNQEEILGRIAQLSDLSGRLWDIANEYGCFDEIEIKRLLRETNQECDRLHFDYARQFDDAYVMQFRGALNEEAPLELSHYDIEEVLRKVYGEPHRLGPACLRIPNAALLSPGSILGVRVGNHPTKEGHRAYKSRAWTVWCPM
jgi:hypothetical protein